MSINFFLSLGTTTTAIGTTMTTGGDTSAGGSDEMQTGRNLELSSPQEPGAANGELFRCYFDCMQMLYTMGACRKSSSAV
jgi:hypothetical protein